jgi:hypothetical protein
MKWKCWKKGISPAEFRKCYAKDLRDIDDIENAVSAKIKSEIEINKLMNSMRQNKRW